MLGLQSLSILFLVLSQVKLGQTFQLIRGQRDRFSNPKCDGSNCVKTCSQYYAKCINSSLCQFCICDENSPTYVATEKKCMSDEETFTPSAPKYSLFGISDGLGNNFIAASSSGVLTVESKNNANAMQRWMYTTTGRLLNVGTLKCIDAQRHSHVALRPCRVSGSDTQEWKCDRSLNGLYLTVKGRDEYLGFYGERLFISFLDRKMRYEWVPFVGNTLSRSICERPEVYQGCYRFQNGDFVTYISESNGDDCKNKKTSECFEVMRISAPIFVNNTYCTLLWNESMFSVDDQPWTKLSGYHNHFNLSKGTEQPGELRLKMHRQAKMVWAGALLKLEIHCQDISKKQNEQHCVLLKFNGKYKLQPTPVPTTPGHAMVKGQQSLSRNNPYKASTIALSIIACILLVLLVFGVFLAYRRNIPLWPRTRDDSESYAKPFCEAEERPEI